MFKVGRDVIIFRGHSQKEGPLSTDLSHNWPFSRAILWKKTKQKKNTLDQMQKLARAHESSSTQTLLSVDLFQVLTCCP